MKSVEELSSTCTQLSTEYVLQKALEQEQAEALGRTRYERVVNVRSEHEMIEPLLCSAGAATVGTGTRCYVLRKRHPCRFGLTPLRTAMKKMSKGDCIA
jgi:hypothetical protein